MESQEDAYKIENNLFVKVLLFFLILFSLLLISSFFYLSEIRLVSLALIALIGLLSYKKLIYGIYSFVFTLPIMYFPSLFGKNLALSEVVIFIIAFIFSIKNFSQKVIEIKKTKLDILLLISLLLTFLLFMPQIIQLNSISSILNITTSSPYFILRTLLVTFEFTLIYFFTTTIVKKKNLNNMISILIVSTIIASVYGFFQLFFLDYSRITSFFENPNFFGMFLIMIIPLSIYFYFFKKKKIFLFIPIIFLLSLFLTFSRGAWLGFFISILFLLVFNKKLNLNKIYLLVPFIILIMFSIIFLININQENFYSNNKFISTFTERFSSISTTLEDRLDIWNAYLTKIKDHLSFGQPPIVLEVNNSQVEHAHNLYLQILLEKGIFGLIIFFLILFCLFKEVKKESSFYSLALFTGIIAFLTHGLLDYNLKINLLFSLYLALIELPS